MNYQKVEFFNKETNNWFWSVIVYLDNNTTFNPEIFAKECPLPDFLGDAKVKDKREIMTGMKFDGRVYPTR
jgi:hypothetical protein